MSKEYFLEYLPKQKGFEKGAANNEGYKRVSMLFKRESVILVQITFLIDAAIPFQKFLIQRTQKFAEIGCFEIYWSQDLRRKVWSKSCQNCSAFTRKSIFIG